MRRNTVFWGLILVIMGVLLLLQNLGLIPASLNLWGVFWPCVLIGLGILTIWRVVRPRQARATESVTLPLEDAPRARLKLRHGAGRLTLGAGAAPLELLAGECAGGPEVTTRRDGDELCATLRVPDDSWMWMRGPTDPVDWTLRLNGSVPMALDVKTGASENRLDLSQLQVTELDLNTGASATEVILPAQAGYTRVTIAAGAAALRIQVPDGVAARIHRVTAVGGSAIDSQRFPPAAQGHQSPDFETAPHRVEISVTIGAGSVDIR